MDPIDLVARDDATEDELVAVFVGSVVPQRVRCAALNHPNMSAARVDAIVAMGGAPADRALAMTTATDVLERWAASPDPYMRAVCAFNPATPAPVLMELVDGPEPAVRVNAAMNGGLPRSERARVALHDPEEAVREAVVWAMTTAGGRDIIDGGRYAVMHHGEGDAPPEEYRIIVYPLAGPGEDS